MQLIKPTAALSASLLARKGQARPALRPSLPLGLDEATPGTEGPVVLPTPKQVDRIDVRALLTPANAPANTIDEAYEDETLDDLPPARETSRAPALPVAMTVADAVTASTPVMPVARAAAGSKGKSAFTLRLDPERHLRLRLSAAHQHRSAQALMIEALDTYLQQCTPLFTKGNCVCREGGNG